MLKIGKIDIIQNSVISYFKAEMFQQEMTNQDAQNGQL